MNVELGLWPRNSFPGNIYFQFSVLVLCGAPASNLLVCECSYLRQWKSVWEGVLVGSGVEGWDQGGEGEGGQGEDQVQGVRHSQQHQQPQHN